MMRLINGSLVRVFFNSDGAEAGAVAEAAPAPAAPAKKAAAKKPTKVAKKKVAKKAPKKAAKKTAKKAVPTGGQGDKRDTVRLRMFRLLGKKSDGLTGAAIKEALELGGVPNILKDECMGDPPRIRRLDIEGTRGVVYQLTAAGKKAIENGTVNSGAPESAAGKEWPNGR